MSSDPLQGNNEPNPTQRAIRFLKNKPTPKENKEGEDTLKDKPDSQERFYTRNHTSYGFRRPTAFDQMAADRFGEELAPDAVIWSMYLDEAQERDRELVEGRQQSLDTLLLFAALFSAILTAFLIESKDLLQQDPADAATALLLTIAKSQQRIELGLPAPEESTEVLHIPEFVPSLYARWINGIWFMSLGLSLSAALIAMLGKEWLTTFHSSRPRSPRRLAFNRQARLKGLEDWGALHIIALLPTLLHLSLLLFSVGLVIYLWALDAALAGILSGVIGVTLAFYVVTGILGAVYEFCPFVTEVSQYTQRAVEAIFNLSSKDLNGDSVVPSFQVLQALVWLSKQAEDPTVVDYAYQAMAGLHHSSYIVSDTMHLPPDLTPNTIASDETPLYGHDVTVNSLLTKVMARFDDLLVGTLETASMDPPVCRNMNAIIALGSYLAKSSDAALASTHWLDILAGIDTIWSSNLPPNSLSGSNFAGVLIAQMDVFKMVMENMPLILSPNICSSELGVFTEPETVGTNGQNHHHHHIEIQTPNTPLDQAKNDSVSRLNSRLIEWLYLSLTLLQSNAKGETDIATYLVDGLFRASSSAAYYLKRTHSVLHSQNRTNSAPGFRQNITESLKILIFLLSQPTNHMPESVVQLTEILKIYSHIAPMVLRSFNQQDDIDFAHPFNFRDLNSNPPTTRSEAVYISVRYMMISLGYLCRLLPEHPECEDIFTSAVNLVFLRTDEERDYDPEIPTPRQGVAQHLGDYITVLRFVASNESNLERLTRKTIDYICIIANYPWTDEPAFGMYVPSSLLLTLIRMFARSYLVPDTAQEFVQMIVKRLRNPTLALAQLPPQVTPISEPGPTLDYLRQMTHLPGAFSDLVIAGSNHDTHANAVVRGIADIAIIAANRDPAFIVEPVELHPSAVPGFLEAISWTLPRLASLEGGENLLNRFIVSASVLLVTACEDQESREQIARGSGWTSLLTKLHDNKEEYLQIIGEGEWHRLVNGLSLGEGVTPESSDEPEVALSATKSQGVSLDIN